MKAKNASIAQKTLEERIEIPEQEFILDVLKIVKQYENLADRNMQVIHEIRSYQNLGYHIKCYQSTKGELTYEVKLPGKIGF